MKRWAVVLATLLVCAAGGWYLIQNKLQSPKDNTPTVFESAIQQDIKKSINGIGTLQAVQQMEHSTPLAGTLKQVVVVGQRVKKGQILAIIHQDSKTSDLQDARFQVQEAQQALQSAQMQQKNRVAEQKETIRQKEMGVHKTQEEIRRKKDQLQTQNRLYEIGAISRNERDSAAAELSLAIHNEQEAQSSLDDAKEALVRLQSSLQLNLQETQLKLENARDKQKRLQQGEQWILKSNLEGTVTDVKGILGQEVNAGVLVTVHNTNELMVKITIDESQIQQVKMHARAEVHVDALKDTDLQGRVTQISPVGRNEQNIPVFDVQVKLMDPPKNLKPGMGVDVDVIVQESQMVLTIPTRAVQTINSRHYVQIKRGETTEYTPVELGDQQGDRVVVKHGLKAGDAVQVSSAASQESP